MTCAGMWRIDVGMRAAAEGAAGLLNQPPRDGCSPGAVGVAQHGQRVTSSEQRTRDDMAPEQMKKLPRPGRDGE